MKVQSQDPRSPITAGQAAILTISDRKEAESATKIIEEEQVRCGLGDVYEAVRSSKSEDKVTVRLKFDILMHAESCKRIEFELCRQGFKVHWFYAQNNLVVSWAHAISDHIEVEDPAFRQPAQEPEF